MEAKTIQNRYVLQDTLGHGSMGVVYLAYDRLHGDTLALKQIQRPIDQLELDITTYVPKQETSRHALVREFQHLASLKHPYIINVLDFGFDEHNLPFFTMDYLESAQSITDYARDLLQDTKIQLLVQVLEALAYIHHRQVLHRDLKPDNILIAEKQVHLLDFGLSVRQQEAHEQGGTLAYMAPELFQGAKASVATDLYAFGVIAYQTFANKLPFLPTDLDGMLSRPPDVSSLDLDAPLQLILERLLLKIPEARYPSAQALIQAFTELESVTLPEHHIEIRESYLQTAEFVGREDERQQLRNALDNLASNRGSSWLIGGESGVGKSRLLNELRIDALVQGIPVLRGQAVDGGGLPYQLWRQIVRRLVLSTPVTNAEAGILKAIVPNIDTLLARPIALATELAGTAQQQRLVMTIANLFKRQTKPLLLILEDLQWTDESLAPLQQLNAIVAQLPLLILGSYRRDESPDLPASLPQMQVMTLDRFEPLQIAKLSQSMLGKVGEQPHLVEFFNRETEGNVFFLVEVIRTLAEQSKDLTALGQTTLPDTVLSGGINRVIQYRLQRIPKQHRETLELAAVQGRWLDLDLMKHLMPPVQLDDWIAICSEAMVLDTQDERWRFAHDKLRESLIDSLSNNKRKALNRKVAKAIEAVYADDLETYSAILTQHWHQAKNVEKEAHYAYMAGKLAEKSCRYEEALRLFQRVKQLQEAQPDIEQSRIAETLYELGSTYKLMGRYDEARDWLGKALDLFKALNIKEKIKDTLSNIGDLDVRQGDYELAEKRLNESLALSRELEDNFRIATDLMHLGNLAQTQHRFQDALTIRQESYRLMKEVGEPLDICKTLNNLALAYDMLGEIDQAMTYHREALAIRREVNDPHGIAISLINMGAIANDQKDYQTALEYGKESLELFRAMDNLYAVSYALGLLGDIAQGQNQLSEAKTYFEESLDLRRQTKDKQGIAGSLNALGKIAIEERHYQQAWDHYVESLELRIELKVEPNILTQLDNFADLLTKLNQQELAYLILSVLQQQVDLPKSIDNLDSRIEESKSQLTGDVQARLDTEANTLTIEALSQRVLTVKQKTLFGQV